MQIQSYAAPITALRQTADTNLPLPAVVDQLADIQVAIAVLENLEANLKATLAASGLSEVCGTSVRATISRIAAGVTVEWSALAKSFGPSDEQLAKFSKKREAQVRVALKGYN